MRNVKNLLTISALLFFSFTANAQLQIACPISLPPQPDKSADRWIDCGRNVITPNNFSGNVGIGVQSPATRFHVKTYQSPNGTTNLLNFGIRSEANSTGSNYGVQSFATGTQQGIGIGYSANVTGFGNTANWGLNAMVSGSPSGWMGAANYGVYALVTGQANTNYGIYASAGGATGSDWAGFFAGNVYTTGSYQSSDAKLKDNITTFHGGIEQINLLSVKSYMYKTDEFSNMVLPKGLQIGLIAQELETVFPGLVTTAIQPDYDPVTQEPGDRFVEFKAVNYTGLIPVLIEAVQELDADRKERESRIAQLESELDELRKSMEGNIQSSERIGVDGSNNKESLSFKLFQNSPNPFGNKTTIRFYIPYDASNATLKIFNSQGRLVHTEKSLADGYGHIDIDGDELTVGIYIYSLVVDGQKQTKTFYITK